MTDAGEQAVREWVDAMPKLKDFGNPIFRDPKSKEWVNAGSRFPVQEAFLAGYRAGLEASPSEELVKLVEAQRQAEETMLSVVPIGAHGAVHARLMTQWIDAGAAVDHALAALRTTKEGEE